MIVNSKAINIIVDLKKRTTFDFHLKCCIKMRMYLLAYLLLFSVTVIKSENITDYNFHVNHITLNEGLPQNTVNDIYRDSYGFMWFATGNGLCRYDGHKLEVFSKPTLPSNLIRTITETDDKILWIGTSNGLIRYNLRLEKFLPTVILKDSGQQPDVLTLYLDSSHKLWVGTANNGLYYIDTNDSVKVIHHFNSGNSVLKRNRVNDIIQLTDGRVVIGTSNGLFLYNTNRKSLVLWPYEVSYNNNIITLFEANDGALWIGTFYGVAIVEVSSNRIEEFLPDPYNKQSLIHGTVTDIAQDIMGDIYVGTLGGLDIYSPGTGSFLHIPSQSSNVFSMNNRFVRSILTDNFGSVWIGTESGGVNVFNRYQTPFHSMTHKRRENSLSSSTINSIYSNEKYLWVGTAGGGLNRYNWKTKLFKHYKFDPAIKESLSNNFVSSLLETPSGDLWVGTWGGGMCKLVGSERFKNLNPIINSRVEEFENLFVSSFLYDDEGLLLIGCEGGLSVLDLETESFISHNKINKELGQISEIGCLLKDKDDFLWIGTRKGLYRVKMSHLFRNKDEELKTTTIQRFKSSSQGADNKNLPGEFVISLFEDPKEGIIWIGTFGDGLVRCTKNIQGEFEFESINRKKGISNDVIYTIEQDENGDLWLGTDKGLCRYNPFLHKITNYYSEDGLISDQFYWSASFHSPNGQMFFGAVDGLNIFTPSAFPKYPFETEVSITGLKVFNKKVDIGEERYNEVVLDESLSETNEITLSYKDNAFTIEFASLDYFQPEKIKYRYILEGVDKNWVEVSSNQRFASYTNLKGGTYQFRVIASNSNGEWNQKEKLLTINIQPPYWQTPWFQLALFIFGFLLIIVIGHYRNRRLQFQKRKLEYLVDERTSKIKSQSLQLKKQAEEIKEAYINLETTNTQIEGQKIELEQKTDEILNQHEQLKKMHSEVEELNQHRMQFFTNISHELRTPLSLIIGPVESLIVDAEAPSVMKKTLNTIHKNASRLQLLIDQLLTFRKIETNNERVRLIKGDVGAFIEDIFHAFDGLALQKGIDYNYNDLTQSAQIWFDPKKIENILYNVISNAFKYSSVNGKVECKIELSKSHELLLISIKDDGVGMTKKQQENIFNRFYRITSEDNVNGSGIGLSLVKELVNLLNGQIKVNSVINKGSEFIIQIPCIPENITNAVIDEEEANKYQIDIDWSVRLTQAVMNEEKSVFLNGEPIGCGLLKILVVEDHEELAVFIAESLKREYQFLWAKNGKEGIEMAKKYSPDLIVSDVMMPELDGIKMCSILKESLYTSHIPIIMLTAKSKVEHFVEGLGVGADDYMVKPFSIEILRAKIKNLIDSRRKLKQLFSTSPDEVITKEVKSISTVDDHFIQKSYDVVKAHFGNSDFSVEQFADEMCVSRSLLYKKLKALVDLSPNDFITVYRLKISMKLLTEEKLSINEIAYQVGFNDPKYFSRVFKKIHKKTPSEFIN